jgi:hypothetical protein
MIKGFQRVGGLLFVHQEKTLGNDSIMMTSSND